MAQRFGLLNNDVVVNVIVGSQEFVSTLPGTYVELADNQGLGWHYVEGTLTAPAPEEAPEPESPLMALAKQIAADRYKVEARGITWTDAEGGIWYIDTSLDSQSRVTGAEAAVVAGLRNENGSWKTAKLNPSTGKFELTFRPTTNAEVTEWAGLVHAHVQHCFEVESICLTKVKTALAQDDHTAAYAVNYDQEYADYMAAL